MTAAALPYISLPALLLVLLLLLLMHAHSSDVAYFCPDFTTGFPGVACCFLPPNPPLLLVLLLIACWA